MANSQPLRSQHWWRWQSVPVDLALVVGVTLVTITASVVPGLHETLLQFVFGLAFVLFVPGYAFIAAMFPAAGTSPTRATSTVKTTADAASSSVAHTGTPDSRRDGIDGLERVLLSAGLNAALIPVVGMALHVTPWGIQQGSFALALGGVTLAAAGIATVRRRRLPPEDRFRVPYRRWAMIIRDAVLEPPTRVDAVLNVVVIIAVVIAMGAITGAVVAPAAVSGLGTSAAPGEQFSSIAVLTEDDGDLVADGYPSTLTAGDATTLVADIENHEQRPVEYTVVLFEQQIDRHDETNVTVTDQRELERFEPTLEHGETWQHHHDVQPTMTGEVRLVWGLYPESVPDDPVLADATDEVSIWLDVNPESAA
ncbi:DUF1616 domain-containing protein [Natronolimnobius sp. AArcel1]|uniref:DUF1616 domain-containing protein n=1 Tax=Natronolimnobius sp. AArcel1 TaxID=1679093 RepID=UPI0013ECF598|nr:DUF1616 domain-containing protein [Natronolimnobius sp. AArcel1]NGM70337.1 DUF1616 domain-containing protein [Natronolimnobius sp. AArcel1]